jgi:hypothetical protein
MIKSHYAQLRQLVSEWNPIGVAGLPDDEYDCLVGQLLSRLHTHASASDIEAFLGEEISGHFGIAVPANTRMFAERVERWFQLAQGSQARTNDTSEENGASQEDQKAFEVLHGVPAAWQDSPMVNGKETTLVVLRRLWSYLSRRS